MTTSLSVLSIAGRVQGQGPAAAEAAEGKGEGATGPDHHGGRDRATEHHQTGQLPHFY